MRASAPGWQPGQPLPAGVVVLEQILHHYDGDAFTGRPVGQVGPYGALTRTEALVFTNAVLDAAYGAERPAFLGGAAALPAGAPPGFAADLGYRKTAAGYYADVVARRLDFQTAGAAQRRGLVLATRDPLGNETRITPDPCWLLPAVVVDPVGLVTTAEYDYLTCQPSTVVDPNGNTTHLTYTGVGALRSRTARNPDQRSVPCVLQVEGWQRLRCGNYGLPLGPKMAKAKAKTKGNAAERVGKLGSLGGPHLPPASWFELANSYWAVCLGEPEYAKYASEVLDRTYSRRDLIEGAAVLAREAQDVWTILATEGRPVHGGISKDKEAQELLAELIYEIDRKEPGKSRPSPVLAAAFLAFVFNQEPATGERLEERWRWWAGWQKDLREMLASGCCTSLYRRVSLVDDV